MKVLLRLTTLAAVFLVFACENPEELVSPKQGGHTDPGTQMKTWSVNGNVQKGPFTQGTTITIQLLDDALSPIGKTYSTKTSDDAGSFSIDSKIGNRFVEIMAVGYYFNEIEGKVSSSTLTLRSLSDLEEEGKTNVNLLTTLEIDRVRALVKGGKTVAEARKQAEQEIFAVFNIPNTVGKTGFDKMDITKGTDADAILLAISASLQAGQTVGELSELISKIAGELASSGKVENDIIRARILEGCRKVDAELVRNNLVRRYTSLGLSDFVIPPFEDYLDVNGNGVIDKKDSWIILGQNDFVVSDQGGTFNLTLQHNVDYEVSVEGGNWLSWQTVETKAYLQDTTITFMAQPNPEPEQRYAVIRVKDKASSHVETATVTQKQRDALTVSKSSVELEKEGGSFEVTIGHNAGVQYSIDVSWITLMQTKAMVSNTLVFSASQNPGVGTRIGHIVFTMNNLSDSVTIYQKGGRTLVLNEKTFTVGPGGGTVSVQATANVDYEVIGPGVAWMTTTQEASTQAIVTNNHTWTVEANTTGNHRQATIIFKDKESDLSETVTITQTQNDIIDGQGEYLIPWEGGTLNVTVQTNAEFTPSIQQEGEWLSIVSTKALSSRTVTLSAQANPNITPRMAYLILSTDQGSWQITITQKANAQQVTVHVPTPGSLAQTISEDDLHSIVNLKITGELNEDDLELLKGGSYTGGRYSMEDVVITCDWHVEELDLSGMTTTTNETGAIFQCVPSLQKVVMPLHVEKVTNMAFYLCPSLETVDFGNNSDILTIEGSLTYNSFTGRTYTFGAFEHCVSLQSVTLPDNLEELSAGAFAGCTSLKEIIFPETCNVRKLSPVAYRYNNGISTTWFYQGLFNGCTSLETVFLPKSLRRIEQYAFQGAQFRGVVFPEGLTTIEADWLFDCCSRLEEATLPAMITEFAPGMFRGCKSLKKINTAAPITRYGDFCFDGANSEFLLLDPNSEYGINVFANMDGESLTIPDGFTVIPSGMFSGWSNLKDLDLGNVQEIGFSAFNGCAITSLVLPESVRRVGELAFSSPSLESVEIRSERVVFDGSFSIDQDVSVLMANTVLSATGSFVWRADLGGGSSRLSFTFEEGSRLEEFGIAARSGINSISLPRSVKRLTEKAFYGCSSMRSIELPESLEYIGDQAFYGCEELRKLSIPAGVESIGTLAFGHCIKLYELTIPANTALSYIGDQAFGGTSRDWDKCPELEPFILSGSETLTLGKDVWPFTELIVGKRVKRLIGPEPGNFGSGVYYTNPVTSFTVEEGSVLEEISGDLFARNATVTLPSTLKTFGNNVFQGFTGTLNADFSNVTIIGEKAFYNCQTLPQTLDMTKMFPNVTAVGSLAFSNTPVRNVTFGPNLKSLGQFIFDESEGSLDEVHFLGQTPPETVRYQYYDINWHWLGGRYSNSTKIFVPADSYNAYKQSWGDAPWWSQVLTEK